MCDEWEQSFLPLDDPRAVPPPQLNLFHHCHQCDEEHPAVDTIVHTIHRGRGSSVYSFCSETCRMHFGRGMQAKLDASKVDWTGVNRHEG